jgi:hypothetical protein
VSKIAPTDSTVLITDRRGPPDRTPGRPIGDIRFE